MSRIDFASPHLEDYLTKDGRPRFELWDTPGDAWIRAHALRGRVLSKEVAPERVRGAAEVKRGQERFEKG